MKPQIQEPMYGSMHLVETMEIGANKQKYFHKRSYEYVPKPWFQMLRTSYYYKRINETTVNQQCFDVKYMMIMSGINGVCI